MGEQVQLQAHLYRDDMSVSAVVFVSGYALRAYAKTTLQVFEKNRWTRRDPEEALKATIAKVLAELKPKIAEAQKGPLAPWEKVPQHAIEHEMEHTSDPKEAAKIAHDHLQKDPSYYKKLGLMEAGALDEAIKTRRGRKMRGKGGTRLARERGDCGPDIGGCVMVRTYWRRGREKQKPQSKLAKTLQKRAAAAKKG